ncbi:MAG TPA: asparagine synthase (glutamine-hydrolyzing), partial [Flavisolibacter sp.]|nr:asparagine synthase (glutamine-hydrolyzing) [Flavisolibacter sp.]
MCGIIGQINFKQQKTSTPSLHQIRHRGPDGQGEWTSSGGNVYFGHTRLAIIEPTPAGRQPMHDSKEEFTITFNGEIYNHLSLRNLLPHVTWRSTSDTETLVELLAAKGVQALPLLKGMFAFALHNRLDNSVLLVRDRLGIKPLWFKHTEDSFSFCSEIRPLLTPGKATFQKQALSEYIAFGRMPGDGEIIDGIESFSPGSWMKVFPNGTIEKGKWWPSSSIAAFTKSSKPDAVKRVRELVTTAVEEHLISDVGVGAFLSGGIDSSVVTLLAGKVLGKRLKTFTVGFPQTAFDERKIARLVAAKAGSEHVELEVKESDCLEWVKEAVLSLDMPSVDAINT